MNQNINKNKEICPPIIKFDLAQRIKNDVTFKHGGGQKMPKPELKRVTAPSQDVKYKYEVPRGNLSEFTKTMELFNNNGTNIIEDEIEAIEWLDDGDNNVEELGLIQEHSIYFPNYNRVLTLLILPDIVYGEITL